MLNRSGGEAAPEYDGGDPLGDDDDAGNDDDDDATDTEGIPQIYNLDPGPGTLTHHYRLPLSIVFTDEAAGTAIAVYGPDGLTVPTETVWVEGGSRAWVHPEPRLEPNTEYTVAVGLGAAPLSYTFSTSPIGLLNPGVELSGRVYGLDTSAMTVVAPLGLGSSSDFAPAGDTLLQIADVGDPSVVLNVGLGVDDAGNWSQDVCAAAGPAVIEGDLGIEAALVSGGGDLLSFSLGGAEVLFEDPLLEFDVLPFGDGVSELELSGWLRVSSLNELLDTDSACEMVDALDAGACQSCPVGDGLCVWTELRGGNGVETDTTLLPVGPSELDACPEGPTKFLGCSTHGARGGGLLALALASLGIAFRRRRP
ncbi:MAG: hypothetical protein KDA24_01425 [Deltaproteobacteria bacterium]|nr:hypothetical protein [Deltaproteobacteria bacterium]